MKAADWPAVHAIYAAGIASGDATFDTEPPTWERFDGTRLTGLRSSLLSSMVLQRSQDRHGTPAGAAAMGGLFAGGLGCRALADQTAVSVCVR